MRTLIGMSLLVTAVLTGCGVPAPTVAPPSPSAAAPTSSATEAPSGTSATEAAPRSSSAGAGARCHTAQLSARLGPRVGADPAQGYLPLIYTNTSRQVCLLRGVPGADLHGPADPNGPVYTLFPRQAGIKDVPLRPGASASARLVVLSDQDGSFGSLGSRNWVPTQLVTIPPGETTPLTVSWPAGLTVSRQDSATHPGSWIEAFAAG
jgi:Protein of unknown function (DUF4232)